jgi:hypothetical protein
MEARFPGSRRTYTRLKDVELCGADMHVSHVRMATEHLDMWEQLIGNRKNPLRQASIIGLGTFFRVFTKSITLDELVETVCKRIGIAGRAIQFPFAEPCMDVDKPHQLELLREDLRRQIESAVKPVKRRAAAPRSKPKPAIVRKPKSAKKPSIAKPVKAKPVKK